MSKYTEARKLRDPLALPAMLRRIAERQAGAETRDIIEHAADELEHLQGAAKSIKSAMDAMREDRLPPQTRE